jgi:hypothetical protein
MPPAKTLKAQAPAFARLPGGMLPIGVPTEASERK